VNPRWKQRLLPPVIILGCGLIAGALISLGGQAEKTPPEVTPTIVNVHTAIAEDTTALVQATGLVQPARHVTVVPQVSGKIVEISPNLVPGGRLSEGDTFARIEVRDYQATHAQALSQLRQAELELELERGRVASAKREWGMLQGGEDAPEQSALALRQPHMELAEARVRAARSAVHQTQGNLDRTRLQAPFNAIVVEENVDVGQVVGPGSPIASLVGTDQLWVTVSIPVAALVDLQVPSGAVPGSPARVIHRLGDGTKIIHTGRLQRLSGQLDPATRQAQVTVAVQRPFDPADEAVPLLPGTYVEVEMVGRPMPQVFRVPRSALYDGHRLWVVENGVLAMRDVTVDSGDSQTILISAGLRSGDQIVTSTLSLPIEGQPVQILE